ncbi:unnamed protein product [Prunus brigantina]
MDRSLLSAALCFWSSATNTMNLRFGMMTPTVLDMAALFGLSPLGVEVNAALVAPEAAGSFKAAWPTVAKLAGGEQGHPGVRPLGRSPCAGRKDCTRPIPPWPHLSHASRRGYRWNEAEARRPTLGLPVLAAGLFSRAEDGGQTGRYRAAGQCLRAGPQEA